METSTGDSPLEDTKHVTSSTAEAAAAESNESVTVSMDTSTVELTTTAASPKQPAAEPVQSESTAVNQTDNAIENESHQEDNLDSDEHKSALKRKLDTSDAMAVDEAVPAKQQATENIVNDVELTTESSTNTTVNPAATSESVEDRIETEPTSPPQPPPNTQELLVDEKFRGNLLAQTNEQLRKHLCLSKLAALSNIRGKCIANLTEQFYLEQNLNYLDYEKWRGTLNSRTNPFVQNFIERNYENHATIYQLEQSVCGRFALTGPLVEQTNTRLLASSSSKSLPPGANNAHHALSLTKSELDKSSASETTKSVWERARHEAHVLKRIAELRKEGLWSLKRLPKLVEPARPKTHWDYLLDEMSWMATDFQQERKWKINCCKRLALAVHKHFKEREARADTAAREEAKRVRKQCQTIAREVSLFWKNIERIVKYKQDTLLEEKRKATMSLRLNMIVDQTEKYSSWLMESFNQPADSSTTVATVPPKIEEINDKDPVGENDSDDDEASESSSSEDNESTIDAEEKLIAAGDVNDEIERLRLESELPLDELLKDYKIDQSYFNKENQPQRAQDDDETTDDDDDEGTLNSIGNDDDTQAVDDDDDDDVSSADMSEEEDDEETIEEEERQLREKSYNVQSELDELNADNGLSIEELLAKFAPSKPLTEVKPAASATSVDISQVTPTNITPASTSVNTESNGNLNSF
jgi:hypothetical protein